ncbi:MAG: hypothetical protein JHC95_23035, partial [Solirubrobacteraceae bacterium]|nr:hypothetical protein [Solirubrobacteraceae bacterium]
MTDQPTPVSVGGGDGQGFFSTLLRRAWIPLLSGILVGGLAFLILNSRDKTYETCSYLRVNSGPVDQAILGLPAAQKPITNIIGETAAEIEQYRVAQRAVEFLQLKPFANANQILKVVEAEPDQNSGLITVCAKGRTPSEAQRIANSMARAYVDINRARSQANLRAARRELVRLQRTRVSAVRRQARRGEAGTAAVDSIQETQDQIERLTLAEKINTDSVVVAKPAKLPEGPSGIPPWTIGILGFIIGAALGGALIAVREQNDKRIRTRRQLERIVGAPVLASIRSKGTLKQRLPLDGLTRKEAEPFRLLFAKLRNSTGAEHLETLVIASIDDDGASGSVSWYLSATAAAAGARVLLMEADTDRPSAVDNGEGRPAGVSDILSGRNRLDEVVYHVAADARHAVNIVSPGERNGGAHLRGGHGIQDLIAQAHAEHDLVLIDTPPVVDADAVPFVRNAQGAVLVYRHGGADQDALREARDELA